MLEPIVLTTCSNPVPFTSKGSNLRFRGLKYASCRYLITKKRLQKEALELSNEKNVLRRKKFSSLVLVEFKAPIELVKAFDSKSKIKFSSRSEAIRTLMRMFIDEMEKS
jgi:hypothetical protein